MICAGRSCHFFLQCGKGIAGRVDEFVYGCLHADNCRALCQIISDVHAQIVIAVHGMADSYQIAETVFYAQRRCDCLNQQIAAHNRIGAYTSPVCVFLEGRYAVDLCQNTVIHYLCDNAHILCLSVCACELVGHFLLRIEEGNRHAVRKGSLIGVKLPLACNAVVCGASAIEGNSSNYLGNAL